MTLPELLVRSQVSEQPPDISCSVRIGGPVSPEQVVYASDYPYGQQPSSLFAAIRTARMAGLDEGQLDGMLGGSARRRATVRPAGTLAAGGWTCA